MAANCLYAVVRKYFDNNLDASQVNPLAFTTRVEMVRRNSCEVFERVVIYWDTCCDYSNGFMKNLKEDFLSRNYIVLRGFYNFADECMGIQEYQEKEEEEIIL
jgi:hypothetical protein